MEEPRSKALVKVLRIPQTSDTQIHQMEVQHGFYGLASPLLCWMDSRAWTTKR